MQGKNSASENDDTTQTVSKPRWKSTTPPKGKTIASSHVVKAASVQSEEVPTIPLGSLQTLSTLEPEVSVRSTSATKSVRLPVPLVVQPTEYRRSPGERLQLWWEGIRPAYIALALMPVLVGTTLAWTQSVSPKTPFGHFRFLQFIATLVAVAALQAGANLVNDYYDYVKSIDTSNPLGPGGLIQQGFIRPTRVLNGGLILLILGALIGVFAALASGLFVFLFGVIGLLCAFFYSATSRSLSSVALGELVSLCIFGPLLTIGAYLVQTGGFAERTSLLSVLLYSLPLGLLTTAVVYANNMRDVESDAQSGKRTLATLLSLRVNRILYVLLLLGAYAIIVALGIPRGAPHLVLITLWTLPTLAVAVTGIMRADMPASLHMAMHETLKLQTYFALLLIAALIVSTLIPVLPHLPAHLLPF